MVKGLFKTKEFQNIAYAAPDRRILVAVDGSMKFSRDYEFSGRAVKRRLKSGGEKYFAYVLDATLVLTDGTAVPLLSEFVENASMESEAEKQDCEAKAWKRLAPRLAKLLGRNVCVLADGLYASGPVVSLCRSLGWAYVISLKEGAMKAVWEEAEGLMRADPKNSLSMTHGGRAQTYRWANGIEHAYGGNHRRLELNAAMLDETWTEKHPKSGGREEEKKTRHAWLCSKNLTKENVFQVCGAGRDRWRIENEFKTEKHDGCMFSHCFSYDWNAMKCFHVLMKIGAAIATLAARSELLNQAFLEKGMRGFVSFLRLVFTGAPLDRDAVRAAAASAPRLRFVGGEASFVT
jgi:hypothetical protein